MVRRHATLAPPREQRCCATPNLRRRPAYDTPGGAAGSVSRSSAARAAAPASRDVAPSSSPGGKCALLIIGGGIAAYKSLDLIRRLKERGFAVRCILTAAAQHF